MAEFEAHLEKLQQIWLSTGVRFEEPTSDQAIKEFETRYKVCVPADLREYFLKLNGMESNSVHGLTRLWPLKEVCQLVELFVDSAKPWLEGLIPHVGSYYIIGDYNFQGTYWAIQLDKDCHAENPIIAFAGHTDWWKQSATSFTNFVRIYVEENPESLL